MEPSEVSELWMLQRRIEALETQHRSSPGYRIDPDEIYTTYGLTEVLPYARSYWNKLACRGGGPAYSQPVAGGPRLYAGRDVLEWLMLAKVKSTHAAAVRGRSHRRAIRSTQTNT